MASDLNAKVPYEPSGFFVLRTPLLPIDDFLAWAEAGKKDRIALRRALRAIVERPVVREALHVASPSLGRGIEVWKERPETDDGVKVEAALVRYVSRMMTRPTPFGLFAGCSVGIVGQRTELTVSAAGLGRRHARLDFQVLSAIEAVLIQDRDLRRELSYRPNTSLRPTAGGFRMTERVGDPKGSRFRLVDLEASPCLSAALARAATGARFDELVKALLAMEPDAGEEEASSFVDELVDGNVLVPDLALALTGPDALEALVGQLGGLAAARPVYGKLLAVMQGLRTLNTMPLGGAAAAYYHVSTSLDALGLDIERSKTLQVDVVRPAPELTLGADVVAELLRGAAALYRITDPSNRLDDFRTVFEGRYGQREVPLAEALDDETGIGAVLRDDPTANAPLLANVPVGGHKAPNSPFSTTHELLLRWLERGIARGAHEIVLTDADLERLSTERERGGAMPPAFAVTGTLLARSSEALSRGEYRFWVHNVWGPSGMQILGRMCHTDPTLLEHVRRHLAREEAAAPEAVYAEIVHLPQTRLGNVIARPLLRTHEVPFLGRSGATAERQIRIDDLLLSLKEGRFMLRSRTLGREVRPTLTSAVAFSHEGSLTVFRFLALLQEGRAAMWNWGPLERARSLPRLRWRRLVISPRRWCLTEELARFASAPEDGHPLVAELRSELAWPRFVGVVDGDRVLSVDLDNPLCIDALVNVCRKSKCVELRELFFDEDDLCARSAEGRLTHEVVVPFLRSDVGASRPPEPVRTPGRDGAPAIQRRNPPGSRWLYAKLFTGPAIADAVLVNGIAPLVASLRESHAFDRWFFIRYPDPEFALRLRFHGEPDVLLRVVLPALRESVAPWLDDERVWKMQLDTYEPEVERYGGPEAVDQVERLFETDSDAAIEVLRALGKAGTPDDRWKLAVLGIDRLLSDLGFDRTAKLGILPRASQTDPRLFKVTPAFEHAIGVRYRTERKALEALVADPSTASLPADAVDVLARRSWASRGAVQALAELARTGRLQQPLSVIGGLLAHMHVNRLMPSPLRPQEVVILDFLHRVHESFAAREASS
jgi:thiopeptide-type bacteriocin biosynthesis protein